MPKPENCHRIPQNSHKAREEQIPKTRPRLRDSFILLCLVACGAQFSLAGSLKPPATWWPDPTTGLMWTGQTPNKFYILTPNTVMNWNNANKYCTSLQLGGYSGWRLPTLNELTAITELRHVDAKPTQYTNCNMANSVLDCQRMKMEDAAQPAHETQEFKGGISVPYPMSIWSSTLDGGQKAFVVTPTGNWGDKYFYLGGMIGVSSLELTKGIYSSLGNSIYPTALCTRPMEAETLQIAKDALANRPVPDVLTLKAYALLNEARLAYQAGRFQESIAQAKNAFLIKPNLAPSYWAIGISYGRMGQWDLAIKNLETSLKIDKNDSDAKDALKWAKEGQKAANSGGSLKAPTPVWN
jgi:tetratricopeptide (TPR) repeat protein